MSIRYCLFDLDGTLLPLDQDVFVKAYFSRLAVKLAPLGYDPNALIDAIWKGTAAMVKNDGSRSNEAVFWDYFAFVFGQQAKKDEPFFDEFYRTEFQQIRDVCGFQPKARQAVKLLKSRGCRLVLATNPIFPAVATESRIRWAGLDKSDFDLYTTYENARFCKPNPEYYRDILCRIGAAPEQCLMVGNDVGEDMVAAAQAGIRGFLVTDCLIHKGDTDISAYPQGDFDALLAYLQTMV